MLYDDAARPITTLSSLIVARTATATRKRTRDAMVAAAAKVFLRRGFRGAALREIAAEAGMTTGAVYSNFDGKADLFLAVLEERLDPRLARMYAAAREAPLRRVGASVGEEFSAYLAGRRRWLILLIEFWAAAARDPALRPKFAARHASLRAAVSEVVAERAAQLGYEPLLPVDDLATLLIALTNGMAVERLADPTGVPEDLYARALDILLP
jgi:AcrR family transcriptional regulator